MLIEKVFWLCTDYVQTEMALIWQENMTIFPFAIDVTQAQNLTDIETTSFPEILKHFSKNGDNLLMQVVTLQSFSEIRE